MKLTKTVINSFRGFTYLTGITPHVMGGYCLDVTTNPQDCIVARIVIPSLELE